MGYKHSREEILEAAVAEALERGIGPLSFGRVAKRLGVSDRTVVYYFPNKDSLIEAVIGAQTAQFNAVLGPVFEQAARDHTEVLRIAWPVLASDQADPILRLFLETLGLGARGVSPFDQIVPLAIEAWVGMVMQMFDGPEHRRRAEAEAAIAQIDGLLLIRQAAGPDVADRAARVLMQTTKKG